MDRTVLFVSSSPEHIQILASMLTPLDLQLEVVETVAEVRAKTETTPSVVLTEARLRDGDWHSVLLAVRERDPAAQVLVTHAYADAHFWTDVLEAGAYDIVTQPFHAAEVQRLVLSAWLRYETTVEARRIEPKSAAALAARAAS